MTTLPALMILSLAGLLFSGFPVGFVIGGVALVFALLGHLLGEFRLIELYNLVPRIWGGLAENLVLVAVPCFIFMGTMLEKSGIAERLLHALQVLLRRVPGGMALSVAAMGTVLAASTGIIAASVVLMSLLALPPMLARGYSRPLAAGTVAASGTLGILIPPSIMLVFIAEMLTVSVGRLFMAALFPGLVLAGLYLLFIALTSFLRPALAPPLPPEEGPRDAQAVLRLMLGALLPPAALIVLVLGSIFMGWATVTEAAGVGAAGALVLCALERRLSLALLADVVDRTALLVAMAFLVLIGATAFAYVFRSLGGDLMVVGLIDGAGFGSWGVLATLMALVFVLGLLFDWIEITLIVLPIVAPLLRLLDLGAHVGSPRELVLWFAVLVAVNLQTSFLTPPFGFALFYMKGVAPKALTMPEIYRGIVPFVLLQLTGLAFVLAFPELALWLPRRMLG